MLIPKAKNTEVGFEVTSVAGSVVARLLLEATFAELSQSLAGFIEIGRLLAQAQETLGQRRWHDMVVNDLPFSRRTAEKLIKIASDTRISDPKYATRLPPHWTSLHELTLLTDDQFERGLRDGVIKPDAERKEITALKLVPSGRGAKSAGSGSAKANGQAKLPAPNVPSGSTSAQRIALRTRGGRSPLSSSAAAPLVLAEIVVDSTLDLTSIASFEAALAEVCSQFGATLKMNRTAEALQYVADAEILIRNTYEDTKSGGRNNDIQAIEDRFFELETGTTIRRSGPLPSNDFDDLGLEELYG